MTGGAGEKEERMKGDTEKTTRGRGGSERRNYQRGPVSFYENPATTAWENQ